MIHKLFIGFVIAVLCQSCIKQDEVEVEGSTVLRNNVVALKVGESHTIDVVYVESGKEFTEKGENGEKIQYTYQVDKPNVVSVTSDGVVTALEKGNVNVSVSAFDSPSKKITFNVVASDTSVASIEILDIPSFLVKGEKLDLNVLIKDYLGNEKTNASIETWQSSKSSVASIDNNGSIKTLTAGNTLITAGIGDVLSVSHNLAVIDSTARFGQFYKIDYRTKGKGSLVLNDGESLDIIFASDFEAENATGLPGVVVYLNNGDDANAAISSGLRIGSIPQNTGEFTMSVPIPAGETAVEVFAKYSHILLICEPFKISFGAAKLN